MSGVLKLGNIKETQKFYIDIETKKQLWLAEVRSAQTGELLQIKDVSSNRVIWKKGP